jgi:hypothetical protein
MLNTEEYRGLQKYESPLPNDIYDLLNKLNGDSRCRLFDEIDNGMEPMDAIIERYSNSIKKENRNDN